jgi:hypothetical protein
LKNAEKLSCHCGIVEIYCFTDETRAGPVRNNVGTLLSWRWLANRIVPIEPGAQRDPDTLSKKEIVRNLAAKGGAKKDGKNPRLE